MEIIQGIKEKKDKVHEQTRKIIAEWKPAVGRMLESCLSLDRSLYESHDFVLTNSNLPLYILGKKFDSQKDVDEIKEYVMSRLWFTYRKNFQPIGGTGPTTDQGWGCMLRCGQMLLAQALIKRHLGDNWIWKQMSQEPEYKRILRMFQDKKNCLYSIHQIAQMGVSERKEIGEWFGPNTAAQVLKKLVVFDGWSRLAVHVALDNLLIASDVRTMAFTKPPRRGSRHQTENDLNENCFEAGSTGAESFIDIEIDQCGSEISYSSCSDNLLEEWRPLLIIIPLRLGLTTINPCYLPAIQVFFQMPQCLGIIGGRPNHALYFIGIVDDTLLYLDPHVCQDFVDLDATTLITEKKDGFVQVENGTKTFRDCTYHCPFLLNTTYDRMDPSLALAFLCRTENEYDDLAQNLRSRLLIATDPPLFALQENRPHGFPPFVPYVGESSKLQDYTDLGEVNDSYDEFELLE